MARGARRRGSRRAPALARDRPVTRARPTPAARGETGGEVVAPREWGDAPPPLSLSRNRWRPPARAASGAAAGAWSGGGPEQCTPSSARPNAGWSSTARRKAGSAASKSCRVILWYLRGACSVTSLANKCACGRSAAARSATTARRRGVRSAGCRCRVAVGARPEVVPCELRSRCALGHLPEDGARSPRAARGGGSSSWRKLMGGGSSGGVPSRIDLLLPCHAPVPRTQWLVQSTATRCPDGRRCASS